ncbi:ATP-dependent DNA helicase [Nafulsella turpanensis]|uniref:ATP-dependent DNA helicase n=1 Tax=Nafulsella turpanensis TaxID=1265690 RepID=UPI00034C080F|nr:AAA family ATPase [Nafulsella turpanensis]
MITAHHFFLPLLPFSPTPEQEELFRKLYLFLQAPVEEAGTFILTGYAGTGKTSCLSALAKGVTQLGKTVQFLAPTGRAAKIISTKTGHKALTLHRQLYKTIQNPYSGKVKFELSKNYKDNCLFVVDEASMIGIAEEEGETDLLSDLLRFVFSRTGNKLLLVGDPAQLPPVGSNLSPGLNHEVLQYIYQQKVVSHQLCLVSRQQSDSGIVANAMALRKALEEPQQPFFINSHGYKDVFLLPGNKVTEGLSYAYEKYGIHESLVLCATNREAIHYNQLIRRDLLGRKKILEEGDLLMVARNNYHALPQKGKIDFLANGEFVEVVEVLEEELLGNFRFQNLRLRLPDYPHQRPFNTKILLETLESCEASMSPVRLKELFNLVAVRHVNYFARSRQMQAIRKDPYLNALQVKYAYALTCHKAQGGQWKSVFIRQGFWEQEAPSAEKTRWLYTAVSRASTALFWL